MIQRFILLLIMLATFPPISIDMYLPALPMLGTLWADPNGLIDLSLSLFMAGFSVAILIFGPLSDRVGRRPALLLGVGVYVIASLLCAMSSGPLFLAISRILQGAGAAAASSLGMAMCRDRFEGEQRGQILAYIVTAVALAPALGPSLGAWMLDVANWRWIFLVQAGFGTMTLIGVWFMDETLASPVRRSFFQTLGRYLHVAGNRKFMVMNLAMACMITPFFAFIAGSGDIYIVGFDMDPRHFGYFFGFNAIGIMLGAMACSQIGRNVSKRRAVFSGLMCLFTGGIWMAMVSAPGPWHFAIPFFCISMSLGFIRPICNNEALEQVDTDVGTASSVLMASQFVVAALSMGMISLDWEDKVRTIGMMAIVSASASLAMMMAIRFGEQPSDVCKAT